MYMQEQRLDTGMPYVAKSFKNILEVFRIIFFWGGEAKKSEGRRVINFLWKLENQYVEIQQGILFSRISDNFPIVTTTSASFSCQEYFCPH